MDDRFEAAQIEVVRDDRVTITFGDGYVASFPLRTLREGCPCATCRARRDRGAAVWSGAEPPLVEDARLHGAWGLAIRWSDGHDTGIFPFELLRRWHEAGTEPDPGVPKREL
jgi:DUF971 family protein